jgi:phage repressor protein C with HTH and peptisase S24 domain
MFKPQDAPQEESGSLGFADRMRQALRGRPPANVARAIGVPAQTMDRWVKGRMPKADDALKIADELGIDLRWLLTGEGEMGEAPPDGLVMVPRFDLRLAAGDGAWNERAQSLGSIPFEGAMLRRLLGRAGAGGLAVFQVTGDSMEPTIRDGSLVLVDERDTRLADAVFAFVAVDEARIKRFRRTLTGIEIASDNPLYPAATIEGDALGDLQIIGRVRWIGQSI